MAARTKRAYSFRPATVSRARELAARYSSSQDAVVDRAVRDEAEASRWAEAAEDPEFTSEAAQIAAALDEPDRL